MSPLKIFTAYFWNLCILRDGGQGNLICIYERRTAPVQEWSRACDYRTKAQRGNITLILKMRGQQAVEVENDKENCSYGYQGSMQL